MAKVLMYLNKNNELLKPNNFKRLNGNKNLSKSQLNLLGLKKVSINSNDFRGFVRKIIKDMEVK
jgi:hypothetical protein